MNTSTYNKVLITVNRYLKDKYITGQNNLIKKEKQNN